jgi:NAD(P)-dependent dehydrogenase (short-subunit alcohol dehydrogenase family)
MSSQGKVWFITGTSSGFGRCLAEGAIARGDRVVATARDPRALADLVARAPERVHAPRLDVTKPLEVKGAVASALQRFGAVDVLVNNAGFSVVGAVEETSDEALRETFEPMFFGAVATTRALLPHMRERRSGTIVQMTSVGGLITGPGFGAYCAAKHALEALSESLAVEVAPFGVRVLIIEPGAFRTSLFGPALRRMPPTDAYASTVGPTRAYAASSDGAQPGHPMKAAKAIADAVAAGAPSSRLPLGADAVKSIRLKLAQVAADADRAEAVASATVF